MKLKIQLLATSALVLFTELALIRWLPSQILYLSYFSNLILLASFFGIGLGVILARRRGDLGFLFPPLIFLLTLVTAGTFSLDLSEAGMLYFQSSFSGLVSNYIYIAVLVFILVAAIMLVLSQRLGQLLDKFAPLDAYLWDILGSLVGIAAFTLMSFLRTSPLVWFSVIFSLYFLIFLKRESKFVFSAVAAGAFFVLLVPALSESRWSPYYQLKVVPFQYPNSSETGYYITANKTGHQSIDPLERIEFVYRSPYEFFSEPSYERALIIGSGAGKDTALALQMGVWEIDAVEIDPDIAKLGRELNPLKPYDDPSVILHIDDGRNFLEKTDKKYDLIVLALTDSLTLASTYANTRLESYLFTKEAFESAKDHLTENGLFVMYNYYRQPWLIQKLGRTVADAFGSQPIIYSDANQLATIMIGPKTAAAVKAGNILLRAEEDLQPASDDWPFPYLKRKSIPLSYVETVGVLLAISLSAIFLTRTTGRGQKRVNWYFFLLGAAFLLLETKSVVQFTLLFGSTWIVNSLVFFAILFFVLLAIILTKRGFLPKVRTLYLFLTLLLVLALFFPPQTLLGMNLWLRYAVVSVVTFAPLFFANLLFARLFAKTLDNSFSFGSNLLGAMAGGFLEYSSMLFGYHWLLVVILVLYLASWAVVSARRVSY